MYPQPNEKQPILHTAGGNAAFHNFHNDYGHIQDPKLRRRLALSEIDKVPFGWYHVRAVAVAGIGFFTDSYDIFAINVAIGMIGMAFWQEQGGIVPVNISTAIKTSMAGGTVIGQIAFGRLADMLGRRKMYGIELITIIASTMAQSLTSPSTSMSITGLLIFWRVIMGIGVGGDYPMSAVITSEFAPTKWRGSMMAAVFSMQGGGQFAASLVGLIVTVGFKSSFVEQKFSTCGISCQIAADRGWRIIIGTGALPALWALYYRLTIPETPRYTFDVAQDIEKGDADIQAFKDGKSDIHAFKDNKPDNYPDAVQRERTRRLTRKTPVLPRASWADFVQYFGSWKNGSLLFATMFSWFFLDLVFYGLGFNNGIVLEAIGYGTSTNSVYNTFFNNAVGNLIVVCAGSLPGYWLSVLFIDSLGRRHIQIWGFAILTVLFCIIGFAYNSLNVASLLTLYILVQLFLNFGPNTTTFIIPGECFPTRYRATCHGLSAACGKMGAITAQIISQFLLSKDAPPVCEGNACSPWLPHLMKLFASFALCGTLISLLIPETKRRTLEEIAGEEPAAKSNPTPPTSNLKNWASQSPYLSPLISPMRSPKLESKNRSGGAGSPRPPLVAKSRRSGGETKMDHGYNEDLNSHDIISSRDIGRAYTSDTSIQDYHNLGSSARSFSSSDDAILPSERTAASYTDWGHGNANRRLNLSRHTTEIEMTAARIPIRDVGGLVFKNGNALL